MRTFFSRIHFILTLHCDDASRLASESFERRLALSERLALRCHLVICWSCRHFKRQLQFLHDAFQNLSGDEDAERTPLTLPEDLRQQIKDRMRQRP